MRKRLGMVGLGLMGSAMAENLLKDGFPLTGYDIDESKIERLLRLGIGRASSPREVADASDTVITSLPNSAIVESVVMGEGGLCEGLRQGMVLIDTTTADPEASLRLAQTLEGRGVSMLDATLSGTNRMVLERDLTIMVGGREEIYKECQDIFQSFGSRFFYMGGSGSGALAKLVVNLVLGLNRLVLAEGLTLGMRAGIEGERLLELLKASAAYSRAMDIKGRKMVEGDFETEGKLEFHLKDVELMLKLGRELKVPLLLSGLHAQVLRAGVAQGLGLKDNSAVIAILQKMAGMEVLGKRQAPLVST